MKKLMTVLLAAILCLGLAGVAMAGDTAVVTGYVIVHDTVALELPSDVKIEIAPAEAGSDYAWVETFTKDAFKFSHNHKLMKITAYTVKDGGNALNDIFLEIWLAGSGWIALVEGSSVEVITLPRGVYKEKMGACADATIAKTSAGTYIWTVTFTAQDV